MPAHPDGRPFRSPRVLRRGISRHFPMGRRRGAVRARPAPVGMAAPGARAGGRLRHAGPCHHPRRASRHHPRARGAESSRVPRGRRAAAVGSGDGVRRGGRLRVPALSRGGGTRPLRGGARPRVAPRGPVLSAGVRRHVSRPQRAARRDRGRAAATFLAGRRLAGIALRARDVQEPRGEGRGAGGVCGAHAG